QAEYGIRVFHVTGVQTCALPIFDGLPQRRGADAEAAGHVGDGGEAVARRVAPRLDEGVDALRAVVGQALAQDGGEGVAHGRARKIGRAPCREGVERAAVDDTV